VLAHRTLAMPIDGPEDGTVVDSRDTEPGFQRADGAVNGSAKRDADLAPDAILVSLCSAPIPHPPNGAHRSVGDPVWRKRERCDLRRLPTGRSIRA
jgi:hypothetical protein